LARPRSQKTFSLDHLLQRQAYWQARFDALKAQRDSLPYGPARRKALDKMAPARDALRKIQYNLATTYEAVVAQDNADKFLAEPPIYKDLTQCPHCHKSNTLYPIDAYSVACFQCGFEGWAAQPKFYDFANN
jgi:hypothetical protein